MVVEIWDIFVRNQKITHAPQHDCNIWVRGDIIRKMKLHTIKLLLEVKDLLGPLTVRGHVNK